MITLRDILDTQDLNADKACQAVLDDDFDANKDPCTAIIVNAFQAHDQGDEDAFDNMQADLEYAISQLQKARNFIAYNKPDRP